MENEQAERDGTTKPVSRGQILRRVRGKGNTSFPCSADHEQDWQSYPVDPYCEIFYDHCPPTWCAGDLVLDCVVETCCSSVFICDTLVPRVPFHSWSLYILIPPPPPPPPPLFLSFGRVDLMCLGNFAATAWEKSVYNLPRRRRRDRAR